MLELIARHDAVAVVQEELRLQRLRTGCAPAGGQMIDNRISVGLRLFLDVFRFSTFLVQARWPSVF